MTTLLGSCICHEHWWYLFWQSTVTRILLVFSYLEHIEMPSENKQTTIQFVWGKSDVQIFANNSGQVWEISLEFYAVTPTPCQNCFPFMRFRRYSISNMQSLMIVLQLENVASPIWSCAQKSAFKMFKPHPLLLPSPGLSSPPGYTSSSNVTYEVYF